MRIIEHPIDVCSRRVCVELVIFDIQGIVDSNVGRREFGLSGVSFAPEDLIGITLERLLRANSRENFPELSQAGVALS
jgi:hypothetical protein